MTSLKLIERQLATGVFLTGRDHNENVVQVIQAGADDYMIQQHSERVDRALRRLDLPCPS